MKYEILNLRTRFELLLKIQAFLQSCGWSVYKKSDEILYASNALGTGVIFNFLEYRQKVGNYSMCSTISLCDNIQNSLETNEQENIITIAGFDFQNNANAELNSAVLIGDDKNFALYIGAGTSPEAYNFLFCVGHINKSHDFNGGAVCFTSLAYYYAGSNAYRGDKISASAIPFTKTYYPHAYLKLGGQWRRLNDSGSVLTNLSPNNSDNPLQALSAIALLEINKSEFSGLYTMITPNFFYLNNQNIFVHAGDWDFVRILREKTNKFTNLQNFNIADEKFIHLRPSLFSTNYTTYTMAVRVE